MYETNKHEQEKGTRSRHRVLRTEEKKQFGSEANIVGSAFSQKGCNHNEMKYKVFFISSAMITFLYGNETYSNLRRKLRGTCSNLVKAQFF